MSKPEIDQKEIQSKLQKPKEKLIAFLGGNTELSKSTIKYYTKPSRVERLRENLPMYLSIEKISPAPNQYTPKVLEKMNLLAREENVGVDTIRRDRKALRAIVGLSKGGQEHPDAEFIKALDEPKTAKGVANTVGCSYQTATERLRYLCASGKVERRRNQYGRSFIYSRKTE